MTRSSTKMANEFKNLLDDAVKSLASKKDIDSLRSEWYDNRAGIKNSKVRGKGYDKWRKHSKTRWKSFFVKIRNHIITSCI